jgi:hypothetical protein
LLLVLATLEDWHIHQMDVKSVFLNGELDKEIYMEQPQGFITSGKETQVCRLKKRYMVSNKPPAHGICNSMESSLDSVISRRMPMQAYMYVINKRGMDHSSLSFMSMTLPFWGNHSRQFSDLSQI